VGISPQSQKEREEYDELIPNDDEDEPASQEEIVNMALHLGMDPAKDESLLWIAIEAYDAPLPENWTEHFDWEGKVYFYNNATDQVSRDHPLDEFYRQLYVAYKKAGGGHKDEAATREAAAAAAKQAMANRPPAGIGGPITGGRPSGEVPAADYKKQLEEIDAKRKQSDAVVEALTKALQVQQAGSGSGAPPLPPELLERLKAGDAAAAVEAAKALEGYRGGAGGKTDEEAIRRSTESMVQSGVMKAGEAAIGILKEKLERAEAAAAAAHAEAETERQRVAMMTMEAKVRELEVVAEMARQEAKVEREKAAALTKVSSTSHGAIDEHKRAEKQEEAAARMEAFMEEMRAVKSSGGIDPAALAQLQEALAARAPALAAPAVDEASARRVVELEQTLELERLKFDNQLQGQKRQLEEQRSAFEAQIEEHRKSGGLSAQAKQDMKQLAVRAEQLRTAQQAVREEHNSMQLYVFTKLGQAVASCAANLQMAAREKERYDKMMSAVQDCEERMGPLIREKRRLFNELLTAKGNIRVFCRVRPLSDMERGQGASDAFEYPEDDNSNRLLQLWDGRTKKMFEFDRVFAPSASQEEVFEDVQPLVQAVMDGFNVCIFAYGQTGSGKTHTMEGYNGERGVTFRAFNELFKLAKESWGVYDYEFKVTMIEIYNETIRDLLVKRGEDKEKHDIKTHEDGTVYVDNLNHTCVNDPEDFVNLLKMGSRNRSTGATKMNDRSSRSHLVMGIHVTMTNQARGTKVMSKLSLVDLAGSERLSKSQAEGDRLKESLHINKSLSALGDVIAGLTAKRSHVPFRNSKLTMLLSDSLGNECKTLLFVNCSPSSTNAPESGCSLMFAARARNVDLSGGAGGAAASKKWKEAVQAAQKDQREKENQVSQYQQEADVARDQVVASERRLRELQQQLRDRDQAVEAGAARIEELEAITRDLKAKEKKQRGDMMAMEKDLRKGTDKVSEVDRLQEAIAALQIERDEARRCAQAAAEKAKMAEAAKRSTPPGQLEKELASKEAELVELRAQLKGARRPKSSRSKAGGDADDMDEAEKVRLKEQMVALTDINKQLLDKCKANKDDKVRLEEELAKRDEALKALQKKHKALLKKVVGSKGDGEGGVDGLGPVAGGVAKKIRAGEITPRE